MEDNKNFETQVSENVETTPTEETVGEQVEEIIPEKTYTQSEVDEIVGKRLARNKAKIHKEYERKYGDFDYVSEVLKAGLGTDSIEEATNKLAEFYQSKGVKMPKKPEYKAKDIELLAKAEADDIIRSGYEEVVEEVDRLADKGVANMTEREKAVFKALAEHRQITERNRELTKIGVTEDVINSKEFQNFASQFNSHVSIADIYNIYKQTQPKKEIKTMGSMKNTAVKEVKDFYSPDEIAKLTEEDLDDPAVWEAVRQSMTGRR